MNRQDSNNDKEAEALGRSVAEEFGRISDPVIRATVRKSIMNLIFDAQIAQTEKEARAAAERDARAAADRDARAAATAMNFVVGSDGMLVPYNSTVV